MIDERTLLALVAGVMMLVLVTGGLVRRRLPAAKIARIGLIWFAIIAGATLVATVGQRLLG